MYIRSVVPHTCTWKMWMTSQVGYLKLLISRSILSGPLDFEIKRVACITLIQTCIGHLEKCVKKEWIFRVQTRIISHHNPCKSEHCHMHWVITIFGSKGFPSFWNALQFSKIITHEYVVSTFVSLRWDFMHLWYQYFPPERGGRDTLGITPTKNLFPPGTLTEHFDTGMGP